MYSFVIDVFFMVVTLITLEFLWVKYILEACALYFCGCFLES